MADQKISDLTAVTDVLTTDEYVLARSGDTNKIVGQDLADGLAALMPPAPATVQVAALTYTVSANTHGGASTSGSWLTRPINTLNENDDSLCSAIVSNQFILVAGDYRMLGWAWFVGSGQNRLRLRDVTNSATLVVGDSGYTQSGTPPSAAAPNVAGRFTQASGATLELQYRCAVGRATDGLGTAANMGEVEVYAYLRFEKVS